MPKVMEAGNGCNGRKQHQTSLGIYTGGSTLNVLRVTIASLLTLAKKKSVARTQLVTSIEIEIKIKVYFQFCGHAPLSKELE